MDSVGMSCIIPLYKSSGLNLWMFLKFHLKEIFCHFDELEYFNFVMVAYFCPIHAR